MKLYGIDKIVTLNKKDFKKYDFIKEIITPDYISPVNDDD